MFDAHWGIIPGVRALPRLLFGPPDSPIERSDARRSGPDGQPMSLQAGGGTGPRSPGRRLDARRDGAGDQGCGEPDGPAPTRCHRPGHASIADGGDAPMAGEAVTRGGTGRLGTSRRRLKIQPSWWLGQASAARWSPGPPVLGRPSTPRGRPRRAGDGGSPDRGTAQRRGRGLR